MKASRRILLITATALVVGGAAIMLCAFALAKGDMEQLTSDRRDWVYHTYELSDDEWAALASISCSDDNESIYVEGYDGDTLRVEYWEHQQRSVGVQQDGDSLLIFANTRNDPLTLGVSMGFPDDRATRVLVPRGFAGDLRVGSATGCVSVANIDGREPVSLHVYTENGPAILNHLKAEKAHVQSINGDVQCNTVDVEGDLIASSENGSIDFAGVLAGNMSAESGSGTVSIGASFAIDMLFAASRDGDVTIYGADAPAIDANADSGTIRLALPGDMDDYGIDAASENGYVSAPYSSSSDASREVTARTQDGDLFIEYEGGDLEALAAHNRDRLRALAFDSSN